jgi:hypothetical protein
MLGDACHDIEVRDRPLAAPETHELPALPKLLQPNPGGVFRTGHEFDSGVSADETPGFEITNSNPPD